MKILHLPFCYHPDPPGGTEVYVEALAYGLNERGAEVVIAAPGEAASSHDCNGIPVRRFKISEQVTDPSELYGDGDEAGAREFERILDEEEPDLVHFHAFTRGVSLKLLRAAKRRDHPVIFTYHTPTVTCLRGTLLRWGSEICEGRMDRVLCTGCSLHGLGLNRVAAGLLGGVPASFGAWLGRRGLKGGFWTAARMSELVRLRHECAQSLFSEVDHVVAVCQWVKQLLLCNGVPEVKITLSRQGLPYGTDQAKPTTDRKAWTGEAAGDQLSTLRAQRSVAGGPLKVAFLGRLDRTKGPDVLIRAVRAAPELPVALDLYGVTQGSGGKEYERELRELAGDDSRVAFRPPVPAADVVATLQKYDLLAVPSQWLESGPLVILEAFGAGIPVLGSNLGGIAELVQDGVNGLLVAARDAGAWAAALERLGREPELLKRLRAGIRPPRTMAMVADEMMELYRRFPVRRAKPATSVGNRS